MRTRLRRYGLVWALLAAGLLAGAVLGPPAGADEPNRGPVILVHGWGGSAANMAVMRDAFTAAGYPTYTIDLPGQNNITNGHAIAGLVQTVKAETGAAKIHLVGHSMGGLSARYYLKRLGGVDNVRTYVSMGTSQYGYRPACLLGEQDGGQMCPSSSFLRELNADDDTPGAVAYSTLRSTRDTPHITRLDGGACFHEIAGVKHSDEPESPLFIEAALAAVGGTCPGSNVDLPIE
jgi:triacylglycerol lipase